MRKSVPRKGPQNPAGLAVLLIAATSLAGCSTFGMGGDRMTTGSIGSSGRSNLNQSMPGSLSSGTRVADGDQFVPPENIGNGAVLRSSSPSYVTALPPRSTTTGSISSQDLPVLGTSNGNNNAMSAQHAIQTPQVQIQVAAPKLAAAPALTVVPAGVYTHVIKSGESLYTIAKHYNVTAQSIMVASSIPAPDKIVVGQRVVIPGRPDLLAAIDGVKLPSGKEAALTSASFSPAIADAPAIKEVLPVDSGKPVLAAAKPDLLHAAPVAPFPETETRVASLGNSAVVPVTPLAGRIITSPAAAAVVPGSHNAAAVKPNTLKPLAPTAAKPVQTASIAPAVTAPASVPKPALTDPPVSGAEKFRWPLTGKVVVDFAASKGTGINIAAPEGTPIKAVENGTVIYVGSGVEGYGNLILIRHANGYVSAYANLKDMSVIKGAPVNRGDVIGSTGTTGSVKSPQLHFELRKGAAPVDPVPLLG
jgi:murein DD-endopeptidase MepM/ murein hydrolase activator NlpD